MALSMLKMLARPLGTCLALAALATTGVPAVAAPAAITGTPTEAPENEVQLSVGAGRLVNLPSDMSDLFVADNAIADVQVRSSRQLYIFGKGGGETSVYATNKAGRVVYSATVRVGQNIGSIDQMLGIAMPGAHIAVNTMNGLVLLTGTVQTPEDVAEAERLVQAFVGEKMKVISRLATATPLQVNLQVRFAEVSHSLVKEIGANLATRDKTGGFLFGAGRANRNFVSIGDRTIPISSLPVLDASSKFNLPAGSIELPFDPRTGEFVIGNTPIPVGTTYDFNNPTDGTTVLQAAGKLFGLDIATAFDLSERTGLVSTLAQPNLTAISGETASFLAGGEFPIPISSTLGQVSVEYRQYGVSLAFTPTVLSDGRISMRVRPEVSQLTTDGAVRLNDIEIPALTTRRAETTIELGSGQSFMIAGLMSNSVNNSVDKSPGLGDVPILGNLLKSQSYQKNQTELVIIVTPYLVKPVNANDIVLPTDGFQNATDAQRLFLNRQSDGNGADRPKPTVAPPVTVNATPGAPPPPPTAPRAPSGDQKAAPAPGFSFEQ